MKPLKKQFESLKKRIDFIGRLSTCRFRALPDFIILGAQKAGTTSLYAYLVQHPQVHPAKIKEVHFFDRRYYRGGLFYKSYFPLKHSVKEGEITGEGSPAYLVVPNVAKRIAQTVPNVKLIVLLRDPVERAVSSYFHQVKGGRETLSMRDALNQEEKRIEPAREKLRKKKLFTEKIARQYSRFSYRTKGIYVRQLEEFFRYFDRSQFFIESSETFFNNTEETMENVFKFLGIDSSFKVPDLAPRYVRQNKDQDRIDTSVIKELREFYAPYNQELYTLLGRSFGWKDTSES